MSHQHLNKEIESLQAHLLKIGSLVEDMLMQSMAVLRKPDASIAEEIIVRDKTVDTLEVELEENCLKAIALHQPVAIDLRIITSILKINNDLERVADHAVSIAERSIYHNTTFFPDILHHIERMMEMALYMVKMSIESFFQLDVKIAYDVWSKDRELDLLHKEMFSWMEKKILADAANISSYISFLSVARYLERVGDLATNIAEDVIYIVKGEIYRHQMHIKPF